MSHRSTTKRVSANLRAEVARRRITQVELARVLKMSQPAVSRRLLGHTALNVDELTTISTFLGVDPAVLFGWTPARVPAA